MRAKNVYGWGPYSSEVTIKPAEVPSKMSVPTTTIDGSNVRVSFSAGVDNGETITHYQIVIA